MTRLIAALVLTGATCLAANVPPAMARGACSVCVEHDPIGRCLRWRACTGAQQSGILRRTAPASPGRATAVGGVLEAKGTAIRTARNPQYLQLPASPQQSSFKASGPHR
jgi:hypothetical protein